MGRRDIEVMRGREEERGDEREREVMGEREKEREVKGER